MLSLEFFPISSKIRDNVSTPLENEYPKTLRCGAWAWVDISSHFCWGCFFLSYLSHNLLFCQYINLLRYHSVLFLWIGRQGLASWLVKCQMVYMIYVVKLDLPIKSPNFNVLYEKPVPIRKTTNQSPTIVGTFEVVTVGRDIIRKHFLYNINEQKM